MIIFRTDASPQIGFGHLTRCRALAQALRQQGERCGMVGPNFPYMTEYDQRLFDAWEPLDWAGAESDAVRLAELAWRFGAATLVLDDYRVDEAYQLALRATRLKWLQFEARTDHPIWAHVVLNASPAYTPDDYVPALCNPEAHLLIGPRYAVLRHEFAKLEVRAPNRHVRKVLVTFGGGDDRGGILFALSTLLPRTSSEIRFVVVSGLNNPRNAHNIRQIQLIDSKRVKYEIDPVALPEIFSSCDLAVMAGGSSTHEAACCGLPMILMTIADNQTIQAISWERRGAALNLGELSAVEPEILASTFAQVLADVEKKTSMSVAGSELVDGLGAQRVAQSIRGLAEGRSVEREFRTNAHRLSDHTATVPGNEE